MLPNREGKHMSFYTQMGGGEEKERRSIPEGFAPEKMALTFVAEVMCSYF